MSRLHDRSDVFYTGPLMKKGLEEYMEKIDLPYMTVKERTFTNEDSDGPFFMCHYCGSGGPFIVSLYGGINEAETQDLYDAFQYNKEHYLKDVANVLGNLVKTTYHVTITPEGELNLAPLGKSRFNVMALQEDLFNADSHYVEHLMCANCGNLCDIAMETYEYGGIHPDEVDCYGNQMLITDEATEARYEYDKDGKRVKILHEAITRDGLMEECMRCMYHEEWVEKYDKALVVHNTDKDEGVLVDIRALCDQCSHSHDFWMFRISPLDIFNKKNNINQNPNQLTIEEEDAENIS